MKAISSILLLVLTTLLQIPDSSEKVLQSTNDEDSDRSARGDDVSIASLQTVIDEQAATIQALQEGLQAEKNRAESLATSLDSLKSVVEDLKNGSDDLKDDIGSLRTQLTSSSKAVGFSARFSQDGGQYVGVALGQHTTLIFDDVITNTGGAYDPNTGIFTAPVSGLYSFFLTQMTADSNPHLWLSIRIDGDVLDRIYTEGQGQHDTHDQGASQVTTHLQAGQKVWVRQEDGTAVRGAWFTVFTGYLIQAD